MADSPLLNGAPLNTHKRSYDDVNLANLPSNDSNFWYYPSHGYHSDQDHDLPVGTKYGNWGHKLDRGARWVRRGKMAPWGPGIDEWDADEHARKRIRLLLPSGRPPSPPSPSLPHLRSPSPPACAPYGPPTPAHHSFASFVMDCAITHSFRARLLEDLERATAGLIEGEAHMRVAFGKLWRAMADDPDVRARAGYDVVPKREEEEDEEQDGPSTSAGPVPRRGRAADEQEETDRERRIKRAPDLTPTTHKHFLSSATHPNGDSIDTPYVGPSHGMFASKPEHQLESLEKHLAILRELQDDGREYVERLEEIREGLGTVKAQRQCVWEMVRERALRELQDAAGIATGMA